MRKMTDHITHGTNIDDLVIWGYVECKNRRWMPWVFGILTLGTFNLVLHWNIEIKVRILYRKCALTAAEKVLVQDSYLHKNLENVIKDCSTDLRYFEHKKVKYIWSQMKHNFDPIRGLENVTCKELYSMGGGIDQETQISRQAIYGSNIIDIQVKPIWYLIFYEALNPLYIFQMYTTIVWFTQLYWQFTLAVLLMSMVSIGIIVWEIRRQSTTLREKVQSKSVVRVFREETGYSEMMSDGLVPGDVIEISHDTLMECDAVLLNGTTTVNESLLTGESVPVSKMPLPRHERDMYNSDNHKKHTLFCGTRILQANDPTGEIVKAVVVRTGYSTAKGEIVRSILFPKPVTMKFYSDSMRFVVVSFCLGFIAVVYTAVTYTMNGTPPLKIVQTAFDILTFVVPPSLPACMTIANILAQRRLKSIGIYCLSSKYINLAGNINVVAFDKTGTLTKDCLELQCIMPTEKGRFMTAVDDGGKLEISETLLCVATCHSLIKLDDQVTGDPLDLILFESTKWDLDHGHKEDADYFSIPPSRIVVHEKFENIKVGIIHQFPFVSSLQRMSVICETIGKENLNLFCKGAPETLAKLCNLKTVPRDLPQVLNRFTRAGYRVIALAGRVIHDKFTAEQFRDCNRNDLENELEFYGLVVLQNSLKPETIPALKELHHANIQTVMVTGDNILTAIKTARSCNMISLEKDVIIVQAKKIPNGVDVSYQYSVDDSTPLSASNGINEALIETGQGYCFAMTGETFSLLRQHDITLLQKFILKGNVFARMLPDLKVLLIEELQNIGYTVAMCGDGANDCGALKTANTGISLNTGEASVASPFTAARQNIQCVPTLVREGRCALATSFTIFKHLLACAWVMCVDVLVLYQVSGQMADTQYLYLDVIIVFYPALLFGNIDAYPYLDKIPPPANLVAFEPILSLVSFILFQTATMVSAWISLSQQPWFEEWEYGELGHRDLLGYENSLVFHIMGLSMLWSSIVFCRGPPYRKNIFTARLFTISWIIILFCCSYLMLDPPMWTQKLLTLKVFPGQSFVCFFYGLSLTNLLFCLIYEDFFLNRMMHRVILPIVKDRLNFKPTFQKMEDEIKKDDLWPPFACYGSNNFSTSTSSLEQPVQNIEDFKDFGNSVV